MKSYSIAIREHEEYGENGIVILSNHRDYFEPAITGMTLAHDILEHTVTPHVHGYTDELMALGGVIAGRIEGGWSSKYAPFYIDNLETDIYMLVQSCLMNGDVFTPKINNSKLLNDELMQSIREFVEKGVKIGVHDHFEGEVSDKFIDDNFDIDSIIGWICKGYQKHKKRFAKMKSHDYVHLFDKISEVCDKFIDDEDSQYYDHKLCIDYTNCRVWIETEYDEDY